MILSRGHREKLVMLVALIAVVALLGVPSAVAAPPPNDECSGAIVVPDGPYPVLMPAENISEATPQGEQDPEACSFGATGTDFTVWWSFTPSVTGRYLFSTSAGACAFTETGGRATAPATGSTVYDTVLEVRDACSPVAATLLCNDSAPNCVANVPGAPYFDQAAGGADLTAGHTYFIATGHWSGDVGGVQPGFDSVALTVDLLPAPSNDTCAHPTPLALDRIVTGTTVSSSNDYLSPATTACFSGAGQFPTASPGHDVVFSFVPPDTDVYSFRYVQDNTAAALRTQSPVLYLADNCPAPNAAAPISGCIAAANRMDGATTGNNNRAEEIACVPLTGGAPYYLFFDDSGAGNAGGDLTVEVTRCRRESEPNDSIATATPFVPNSGCFMEGSSSVSGPSGDVDFYDLGAPPAGSKIFAGIDSAASQNSDYQMRVTTATDTLGFDDDDGSGWTGPNAPIIAGPIAPGGEIYARIDSKPTTIPANEPYNLFARIETGPAQVEDLPDPGSALDFLSATKVTGGGFVKGVMATSVDIDCFEFIAHEGDDIVAFSDNNPARTPGTVTNVWPVLETFDRQPPANLRFAGQVVRNVLTPSPGTLLGTTPSVVSEFEHYRARYTGAYMICYTPTTGVNDPPPFAYPLPYQGSISINCGPVPTWGGETADVSVTKTGPAGLLKTGDLVSYTITVTNNDATGIAQDVRLTDTLPAELVFVDLTYDDGFDGNDTACATLPTPGQNDSPIDCTSPSIAPGASVTYTLMAQVVGCTGAGVTIANTAAVTTLSTDPNPANNSANWTSATFDPCVALDQCHDAGTCEPSTGLCSNPAKTDGTACDDGNACTHTDTCQSGSCAGSNPTVCPAGDQCNAAEVCDPATGACGPMSGAFTPSASSPVTVGTNPAFIAMADFNRDGKQDMAVEVASGISIQLGDGSGGFSEAAGSPLASASLPTSVTAADLNGDGNPDLVGADYLGHTLTIWLGDGSGGFSEAAGSPLGTEEAPFAVAISDFNADGKLDIAEANTGSSTVTVLLGDGSGGFVAAGPSTTVGWDPWSIAVGDFNGDGKRDVATAAYLGDNVTILLGDGSGGLSEAAGSPITVGSNPFGMAAGDWNGDGKLDLAVANHASNNVTVLLGDGSGGFSQAAGSPVAVQGGPQSVAVRDLNGDGKQDLAVANAFSNSVTILLGNGSGGFSQAAGSPVGSVTGPIQISVGDVNGDGKPDLAIANNGSTNVTILLNSVLTIPDGHACDDGNACTAGETCGGGACVGGAAINCDDGSSCTTDACNSVTGCVYTPIDCSDGNGCTLDTCTDPGGCQHAVTCEANASQTVPPGGTATTDPANEGATPDHQIQTAVTAPSGGDVTIHEGPATEALPSGYDIVNLQVVIEAPAASVETPLVLAFRIDATALPQGYVLDSLTIFRNGVAVSNCTDSSGQAVPDPCVSSRLLLGDGDVQVTVLTSHASIWNAAFPNCDDGNPCTNDSGGYPACVHTANTAACDDGSVCTTGDTCGGGTCHGGIAVVCNDNNACTTDTCNPATGCVFTNNTNACNDGNACTQTDTCQNGACVGGNYSWSGFLQPVNADGSSVFKLNQTIPAKFKLTGACAGNPDLRANIYFFQLSNVEGPVNEAASNTPADTGTIFRYDPANAQYIFNLGTKGLTEGSWQLGVDLHDGVGIRTVKVGLRK